MDVGVVKLLGMATHSGTIGLLTPQWQCIRSHALEAIQPSGERYFQLSFKTRGQNYHSRSCSVSLATSQLCIRKVEKLSTSTSKRGELKSELPGTAV